MNSIQISTPGSPHFPKLTLQDLKKRLQESFLGLNNKLKAKDPKVKGLFIRVNVERENGKLVYWEEGRFPIGYINEYESATKNVEALLLKTGLEINHLTSFELSGVDVFLTKTEEETPGVSTGS